MYTIDSKVLSNTISRCQAIIALGAKAEANSISLVFQKDGLAIEATNSVASYRSEVPVKVEKSVKLRASLLPDLLLSYAKNYKELVLIPQEDKLGIKAGKAFSAELYYVGATDAVDAAVPKDGKDITAVATVVNQVLPLIGGVRNRTDKNPLGIMLEWGNDAFEIVLGDSHHAVLLEGKLKQKDSGKLTMTLPNLEKIMSIGANFNASESRFVAWSDTDYLSIASQAENLFLANSAKRALADNKAAIVTLKTAAFKKLVSVLTDAVDETSTVNFEITDKEVRGSISTNGGQATSRMVHQGIKGKINKVSVSVHHLTDCLSVVKSDDMRFVLYKNNMLSLEATGKVSVKAAMSVMSVIT